MNPAEHRALAETLAARVYQDTVDPQTLAQLAVVHALLGTSSAAPTPLPIVPKRRDSEWPGLLGLALTFAAILAVVWMVTQ